MDLALTLSLSRLPHVGQSDAARWHEALAKISPPIGRALETIATQFGVSYQTARRKYDAWRANGITGLVNNSIHPDFAKGDATQIQPDTIQYYRRLCIENGRKCRPAFRRLVREYFSGADIPGLTPGAVRTNILPRGWTYSNFQRFAPTPFEIKAARQGLRAAADFRPLVYTSRKEMHFFEELQFDDVWHDVDCSLLERLQRVRPQQLGSMEVLSACLFEWCIKPRIRRDDDTRTSLGPNDLLYLLAAIFGKYGHHPLGTRLNFEAGTATPPDGAIDLIHRLSGGQVKCRIGACTGQAAFLGQYPGQSKGNFRTRALIESFWNLTHNETADRLQFPGQTGANSRINAPDDLHGRARAQDLILRALPALPARVVETLRQPMPEFNQACRAISEINERMNQRGIMPGTEHAIEGFVEAGLVTTDFDVPGLGLISRPDFEARLNGRSPAEKDAIIALCTPRARKLSPREVFDQRRSELKPWRREAIAQLLYPARLPDPVFVGKDHLVTFQDQDLSPEPLRFLAHHFTPGDAFEAVCNPMVNDLLFIYDARPSHKGAWLGVLQPWGRASRADVAATKARISEAEQIKHQLLAPLAQLGDRLARQRADDLEHNNAALEESQSATADAESAARSALRKSANMF
jgi:hypothetical protein